MRPRRGDSRVPPSRRPNCPSGADALTVTDYKNTINLPQTDFPMKADLAQREPGMLAAGQRSDLYGAIRDAARGRARVHPARRPAVRERRDPHRPRGQQDPEGHHRQVAHCWPASMRPTCRAGTATACRSRSRSKRSIGKVGQKARRARPSARPAANTPRSRSTCSAPISSASACSATGSDPTSRWTPRYEARADPRARRRSSRTATSYAGFKPVHWCLDCRSALAEAEVEYEDKHVAGDRRRVSRGRPTGDFAATLRRRRPAHRRHRRCRWRSGPPRPGRCRRTRRWRCGPELEYVLRARSVARRQARSCSCSPKRSRRRRWRATAWTSARCSAARKGAALEGAAARASVLRPRRCR